MSKILVAEDNALLRRSIVDYLGARFPDWPVVEAVDGEEALSVAAEHEPGIVVMDISLPRMDGIEATRRIRALLPATRVVIHSLHDQAVCEDRCLEAGAVRYVCKADGPEALERAIAELMR